MAAVLQPRSRRAPLPVPEVLRSLGCFSLHSQPCVSCCLSSPCQEPSRVLSLQGNRAARAVRDGRAKIITVEETATIGWPDLHRQQHYPKFLSEPQLMFLGKKDFPPELDNPRQSSVSCSNGQLPHTVKICT